jgi:hypothetical protein
LELDRLGLISLVNKEKKLKRKEKEKEKKEKAMKNLIKLTSILCSDTSYIIGLQILVQSLVSLVSARVSYR